MQRSRSGALVRLLSIGAGILAMALLLAWLMGAFGTKVAPGPATDAAPVPPTVALLELRAESEPQVETAIGTIRAVRETAVAARILGRVKALAIERAGQPVQEGQVLAELAADDLQAGLEQARAALVAAETQRDKAKLDFDRTKQLVDSGVAPNDRLDTDAAALRAAEARVEQAKQTAAGASSALAFATVTAPMSGIVVDKKVQVGDVVQPGQPICTLYDPTRLQLVAIVREELAGVLRTGQEVDVRLDALGKQCRGTVAEIVPEAQAETRSFEVKVTGPCQPGIVTGMFGRLLVPLGERAVLRIPDPAVVRVGQLDFVWAVDAKGAAHRRFVRLGASTERGAEVLSGLAAGERVVADARAFDVLHGREGH